MSDIESTEREAAFLRGYQFAVESVEDGKSPRYVRSILYNMRQGAAHAVNRVDYVRTHPTRERRLARHVINREVDSNDWQKENGDGV